MTINTDLINNSGFEESSLYVIRVEVEAFPVIQQVIDSWQEFIQEQVRAGQSSVQLRDCYSALQVISFGLAPKYAEIYQTFLCAVNHDQLGIMQVGEDETAPEDLLILSLVRNPFHLQSSIPDQTKRVRGVGTRLLQEAEKIASCLGKQFLRLTAYQSAESFYHKLGFIPEEFSFDLVKKVSDMKGFEQ